MNAVTNQVQLIGYEPALGAHFERLNMQWITTYFQVEPRDIEVLGQPEKHIIDEGGDIIFAALGNEIVGTVALKPVEPGIAEMTKMAVDEKHRGLGIGWKLATKILEIAKEKGYHKVTLYSNTVLVPAISMYQRLGFREVGQEPGRLQRSTIKMELELDKINSLYPVAEELLDTVNKAVPWLKSIPENRASTRPVYGKWSPKEIIGHLIDSAINNNVRFIRLQEISLLEIPGYQQDSWVKGQAWQLGQWNEQIELWAGMNRHIALAIRAMPSAVLQHKCKINDREPVTLEFLVTDYVVHLKHHLSQVKVLTEDTI
jgi:ribosomal protein S18 acetylase RimI-like enzyme